MRQQAASGAPAVSAVLHASAVLQDALLSRQTSGSLRAVYAPKVAGALCLLRAAVCQPLHSALLFSSLSVQLGTPGQSNYVAANGGLDGLASDLQDRGVRSSSVQWGPWAGGMALSDPGLVQRFENAGLGIITGVQCMWVELSTCLRWPLWRSLQSARRAHPLLMFLLLGWLCRHHRHRPPAGSARQHPARVCSRQRAVAQAPAQPGSHAFHLC